MNNEWSFKKGREKLIVFCNGWGMDSNPFQPLASHEYDLLIVSDYSDQTCEIDVDELAKKYSKIVLICWSMGVAYGQFFFSDKQHHFHNTIAINGTLCPVHDNFGIPTKIFASTLMNLGEESVENFYKRMCRSKDIFEIFLKNRPGRGVNSLHRELQKIGETVSCKEEKNSIFSRVIISKKDLVIPTRNQQRFWQNSNPLLMPGFHFPFYQWQSWDQLIRSIEEKFSNTAVAAK